MAANSTEQKGNRGKRTFNFLLVLMCILLLGYSFLASVAYWRLDRESRVRISHLEKEVDSRQKQMNQMLKDRTGLEASLAEMEQALTELRERQRLADARMQEFRSLLEALKSLRQAGNLTVRVVDGRAVLALPFDILFASGSSKLSGRGQKAIRDLTEVLKGLEDHRFQVEGHTDADPINKPEYTNWELAADRALVVLHTMVAAGMSSHRISAASYGPTKPVAQNRTAGEKARNRRIEIVLVPDLSELPGAAEMQEALDAIQGAK